MDLSDVHDNWERFARERPYWAIWTVDEAGDEAAFYRSGQAQVSLLLRQLESMVELDRTVALDFGCGAGRLTRALASQFDRVVGVDISETMIELARRNTTEQNVEYVHNVRADLTRFESGRFSLIHSAITLQHMEPTYALGYVREFVRLLASGGVAAFEIPPLSPRRRFRRAIRPLVDLRNRVRSRRHPVMEMHGIARSHIEAAIRDSGGELVAVLPGSWYLAAGPRGAPRPASREG